MVRIFLFSLALTTSLFLSAISFASEQCDQLRKIVADGYVYDENYGSITCKKLEEIISSKGIEKLLQNSQISEGPQKIIINSCTDLKELKLSYSAYSIRGEDFKEYFGQDLIDWNNSDFDYFVNYLIDCRNKDFFKHTERNYFKEVVSKFAVELKERYKKEKLLVAIKTALREAKREAKEKAEIEAKKKKEELISNTLKKYANAGPEEGWRNLKWGMTLEEVKALYIDDYVTEGGRKCQEIQLETITLSHPEYDADKYLKFSPKVMDLWCQPEGESLGIFMYDGKFFGKAVGMPDFWSKKENFEMVIKQLREKYPKGKVSQKEGRIGVVGGFEKYKYPSFEYTSDKIKVFNTNHGLYFYDPKVLNEVVNEPLRKKQQEEEKEKQRFKNLF